MDWLSSVLNNLQKQILGDERGAPDGGSVRHRLRERRTNERVQRFQWRLMELDRRLAQLR